MQPTRLWPALFLLSSLALAAPSPAPVAGVAALPGGTRLVCAGTSLWKVGTPAPVKFALPEPCRGLRVSPSGTLALVTGEKAATVWRLSDGQLLTSVTLPDPARWAAFVNDAALLLGGVRGLEQFDLKTQARTLLRPGAVTGLAVAPDGQRAVVGDGGRVQLVSVSQLVSVNQPVSVSGGQVLSGVRCEGSCPVQDVQFSLDGRGAVVRAGNALYALRDGHPATVVLRGDAVASGFPLPGGGVWVLTGGRLERRDAQTGRREAVLRPDGVSGPAAWTPAGGLLFVAGRELVELDQTGQEVGRTALP